MNPTAPDSRPGEPSWSAPMPPSIPPRIPPGVAPPAPTVGQQPAPASPPVPTAPAPAVPPVPAAASPVPTASAQPAPPPPQVSPAQAAPPAPSAVPAPAPLAPPGAPPPDPRPAPASSRKIGVPADVTWRRVSFITPFLEGWKVFTGILAFLTYQNADEALEAYRLLRSGEIVQTEYFFYFLVALGPMLLAWIAIGLLSWWRRTYAVDADGVYLRTGVLRHQLRTARLPRIQSVDIVHPLLGRILGLGQLTVEIAGGSDSSIVIGYLRTSQLEELRERILALAAGVAEPRAAVPALTGPTASTVGTVPGTAVNTAAPNAIAVEAPATSIPRTASSRLPGDMSGLEHPLYTVETPTLIGSILRSGAIVAPLVLAALLTTFLLVGLEMLPSLGESVSRSMDQGFVFSVLAAPLGLATVLWGRFNSGWAFRAAATPAGIRMRHGLTSDISRTLPPGRVHVVYIRQNLLWRGKDWWRVLAGVAGLGAEQNNSDSHESVSVLLPVGSRATALRALWLVAPDLGTPDPDGLLDSALDGMDDDGVGPGDLPASSPGRGFVRVSRRGRIFVPLAWRRNAVTLTDTCIIIRGGRWSRWVSVVPYERIQSLSVTQGPWSRRRGLANLKLQMVSARIPTRVKHLQVQDAWALAEAISQYAVRRRSREQLDRWLARAMTLPAPESR